MLSACDNGMLPLSSFMLLNATEIMRCAMSNDGYKGELESRHLLMF